MQGEMSSADFEGAESFRSLIPTLVQNYAACDIFNADESGLFYKALPTSTLTQRGRNVHGFKSSKDRLTLLFICNATGDYKKIIVIGKTKKPRCFKNKSVPLEYYSNRKAWMTQDIWTQILFSLDEEMIKQQRKIILFVDNAACHKKLDNLKNINLQFLPPNATSIIQPLDQGIIHCFKAYYRQNIIRKQIAAFEAGKTIEEFSKSLTFLQAMHISKYCLWLITPSTVRNCFRKAGFFEEIEEESEDDVTITDNLVDNHEFQTYLACDDNISCWGELTDAEILENLNEDKNLETVENDEDEII
ncbi:tigger transposable element-derived protein 6-like [Eupeodes corollae]|uniref:tigger transposable element-derived protein 6-like n=1 Tax=Eupeodes corollae TaxID=290404 RepID=UPI002493441C|nr:tigger transposable element-derived protein 6-like [Eupeodes corollae]